MPESAASLCYNKGCGQSFAEGENGAEACRFHPGNPVFHDAYKGWGCCNKKVTDFTEFLNIPGCTRGPHNPTKPPEPERRPIVEQSGGVGEVESSGSVVAPTAKAPPKAADRDAATGEMVELKRSVARGLQVALAEKEAAEASAKEAGSGGQTTEAAEEEIAPGTACKNSACGRSFGPDTPANCWHHPGTAIFHEGMKYWSCCNKKTSDFDAFLSQPGCTRGEHRWRGDAEEGAKELEAREDFHQTPTHVVLTYYLKRSHPNLVSVSANRVRLSLRLASIDGGRKDIEAELWGAIAVADSCVSQTPSKVEIKLRKADPVAWPMLRYKPPPPSDQ